MSRRFLVAIHDVTPAHERALQRIYALLDELGIRQYALLVVPDWHGQWPLDRHPHFVADLIDRQRRGAEVFLHGYRHDEVGFRRSWIQSLRIAGRTAAAAEFRVLPPAEAQRRLDLGLTLFAKLRLEPVGFIAPAWLAGPGTSSWLRDRQLRITEGFWNIIRLHDGRRRFAPAISWSTRTAWRSRACAWIAGYRAGVERHRPVVRVAIHPPDIEFPIVRQSLRATLAALLQSRRVATYGQVVEEM